MKEMELKNGKMHMVKNEKSEISAYFADLGAAVSGLGMSQKVMGKLGLAL